MNDAPSHEPRTGLEIAVIGMAGRFPGASSIDEFWRNLENGVESIVTLSDDELKGIVPEAMLRDPNYIRVKGVLADTDMFDAEFFGFSPREAEITDPQHRLFLECAWETLENAGYDPETSNYRIGVLAGSSASGYVWAAMSSVADGSADLLQVLIGNDKDFLSTRVSYKFNLKGPSISIQTACSTSLIASHLAVQSLLAGDCDMALAGGVSISYPPNTGYRFQEGGLYSPDGHCRAFDADARGTVGGNGVACVLLKRLDDALADRDTIHAVIRGSAVNNDGIGKIGYTAPSIEGQRQVIRSAHARAELSPDSIGYIETHGTGTELGDPIEIAALIQAFQSCTNKKQFCALGSLKTNVGHLDAAAGVAGLIKAALVVKSGRIPPSLHFARPNPNIDFTNGPFYVNTELRQWKNNGSPRRAGVSSFGVGGTNGHMVLEEPPQRPPSGESRPWQLLLLSAKSPSAVEKGVRNLASHLEQHPEQALADVAYTLQVGRKHFSHRRMVRCATQAQAIEALRSGSAEERLVEESIVARRPMVFLFPGGGTQYVGMGRELYQSEALFRSTVDESAQLLQKHTGYDLRTLLYPVPDGSTAEASRKLNAISYALPAIFVTEYALAKLLISWGVRPDAMIGHSLGEYVASCLAGVITLEDALCLVDLRARLLKTLPSGAMLSVALSADALERLAGGKLSIAAINTHSQCTVSGSIEAIKAFEAQLSAKEVEYRRLHIDVPAHSAAVAPIMDELTRFAVHFSVKKPSIRYVSNVSGTWISDSQLSDPAYWAAHLRSTVRFSEGVDEALKLKNAVFLEVGPGTTLGTLISLHTGDQKTPPIIYSMRHPNNTQSDCAVLMSAVGRLWLQNVPIDWGKFYRNERRYRVALPTYPFERRRFSIGGGLPVIPENKAARVSGRHPEQPMASRENGDSTGDKVSQPLRTKHARPALSSPYVPGETHVEREMAAIWQDLFDIEKIGIQDNFLELGGSSLVAIRLIARICDRFAVRLRTHDVMKAPTIAQLAELVVSQQRIPQMDGEVPPSSAVVEIQSGDSPQALILLPPIGGSLFGLHALARRIHPSLRVYGLYPPALDGAITSMATVEQEAEFYIRALRSVCPQGPYNLAGASYGGVVAFEMAHQLYRQNEEVALLALVDTPSPTEMTVKPDNDTELTAMLVKTLLGDPSSDVIGNLANQSHTEQVASISAELKAARLLPHDIDDLQAQWIINLWKSNARAMLRYSPRPYPGRGVFFRAATRTPGQPQNPEIPWIDLMLGGLEVHVVPGDHFSILSEPHSLGLSEKLRQMMVSVMPAAVGRLEADISV